MNEYKLYSFTDPTLTFFGEYQVEAPDEDTALERITEQLANRIEFGASPSVSAKDFEEIEREDDWRVM